MRDFLHELISNQTNPINKRNLVREYLQARILESLQRSGAMIPLAFQGGTALRFLFRIARFSEGLDFALERPSANYDFRSYLKEIQSVFTAEGYNVQIKLNDQDIKRARQIAQYPWFAHKKPWQKEIEMMLKNGFKLEVEALISKDISYVTAEYVPSRLTEAVFLD